MVIRIFLGIVAISWLATTQAADPARGKLLVEQHCVSCHDSTTYTNQTRTVKSLPELLEQVQRCVLANGLSWGETEISDVAAYLNANFYHMGEKTP